MKICDLNQEGKVSLFCLITRVEVGKTNKNLPYLSLTLEDDSGILDAKYWNIPEEMVKLYQPGQVVEVKGDLISYRNAWQLRVRSMDIQENADVMNYVQKPPMPVAEMKENIHALAEAMENPVLRQMSLKLLEAAGPKFYSWPAAVKNHHNFPGGLAWHSLTMASMAQDLMQFYPWLDKDLLVAGILFHDMGKIQELSAPIVPEYTVEGNLLGHISIMNTLVDRMAVELGVEATEEVMLLKHMILSHHGKMEYGSPVLPMIPEAEVLTLLDNLDARMFMMQQALSAIEPGKFGPRIFALDNRMLYRKSWGSYGSEPSQEADQEASAADAANAMDAGTKESSETH